MGEADRCYVAVWAEADVKVRWGPEPLRRSSGDVESDENVRRLVTMYFTTALQQNVRTGLSVRMAGEMRTLADARDWLLSGDVAEAGDILTQHFRALETAVADGSWDLARPFEVIPSSAVSCTQIEMKQGAVQREALEQRVRRHGCHPVKGMPGGWD